jgi:hypothetical protein
MRLVFVFSEGKTVVRLALAKSGDSIVSASKKGKAEDCERECARAFLGGTAGPGPE